MFASVLFLLFGVFFITFYNKMPRDKTNKVTRKPSEDLDQREPSPSLICLLCPPEDTIRPQLLSAQRGVDQTRRMTLLI